MALDNIKCFILDMDGTFYLGDRLLPGAMEFIDFLKATGRDYLFLTNNSSRNAAFYADKIKRMGLCDITDDKVFTSGQAAAIYLNRLDKGKRIFLVGTLYLRQELEQGGLVMVDDKPDFVVVGFDTTLTYDKLWKACDFIREGVAYIATHPDLNCPVEGGFMPDCGAIIAFIEASTGKRPFIIGKPYGEIIRCIFDKTGLEAQQLAIVGDRLYTDIQTGINGGITSILVLSGETTADDLERSDIKPDYVVDGIGDIIKLMR